MKNNAIKVILICAAVGAVVLVVYKPATSNSVVATAPNSDSPRGSIQGSPILTQTVSDQKHSESSILSSSEIEELKVIENGLRSLESEDGAERSRLARLGNAAMESFLKIKSPIGKTPDELKVLFGKPKEETDDFLLYAFDNGGSALLYQFVISNGRVVELTRPLSE